MDAGTEQLHEAGLDTAGEVRVARALISVSDKTGVVEFARGLSGLGIEIISTGGTATALAEAGIHVRSISDLTGFPEIMDGRVKTLHPRLYAGLLALRDDPDHVRTVEEHDVEFIDLVCVNLYPFERTAARRDTSEREVIENIDIGGPTLIRAAAKNWCYVAPVTTPESYDAVLDELCGSDRRLSPATRESLAAEAFAVTARYDAAIARWFQEKRDDFPPLLVRAYEKVLELPYGENPHQRGAYYAQLGASTHLLSAVSQLGGKPLSFNNLLDLDAARDLLGEFQVPACVIVKHNNPCGVALGSDVLEAYQGAFAADPLSAYGGIVCLNRRVERQLAVALVDQFIEVLCAPGYDAGALEVLRTRENMRILDDREERSRSQIEADFRQVAGGMLVEDRDTGLEQREEMTVVSARQPTEAEWSEALFAWKVCKHVRSNAIVLSAGLRTVGVGAGQMSRVDAVRIALEKHSALADSARDGSMPDTEARLRERIAMASDAFFPFPDSAELATAAGVTVIIEPGGSIRDPLVIDAVDKAGAALIFTSRRHFRH